jgi:hypothetical protein
VRLVRVNQRQPAWLPARSQLGWLGLIHAAENTLRALFIRSCEKANIKQPYVPRNVLLTLAMVLSGGFLKNGGIPHVRE